MLLLAVIGVQAYRLSAQRRDLEAEVNRIESQVQILARENESIESDLSYYADPENLMKEFRSLFNYREPNEELYIIVPKR